jgi:heme exporter protein A
MRLVVEGLLGERAGETVFSGVAFALRDGETLTVTGPNGSGKSTLLRTISGLLHLSAGSVRLEEGEERWPDVASACHYLGHQNAMKTSISVGENLRFWQAFCGDAHLTIDSALERVGLGHTMRLPFASLSAGQKRRASIARLLVSHRPIWLLDEPTAGLDKASETQVVDLVIEHCATGGIVLLATHIALGVGSRASLDMAGHA